MDRDRRRRVTLSRYEMWAAANLWSVAHVNGKIDMDRISPAFKPLFEHLAGLPIDARAAPWHGWLLGRADRADLIKALGDCKPEGPPPGDEEEGGQSEPSVPALEWPEPPGEAAFHGLAGKIVKLIEPTTEADPAGLLLHLLVGFGNAIGRGMWTVADGHFHQANEFAVIVGASSRARKDTARRRIRPVLCHGDAPWEQARIAHGLSSGEGLINEIRDTVFVPDQKGDPVGIYAGVEDKRLLVIESEFGNVLRVLAREGSTLSAVLRLAWDGDDLRTMTKKSSLRASKPHVSLISHITRHELVKYFSEVEIFNGLGNRILWCCVRRSKLLPFGGFCNQEALADLGKMLSQAVEQAKLVGELKWSDSSRTQWAAEYPALTADRPGLWGAITSRAEAHVLRLAMIYAALDRWPEIGDIHIAAALELWRYCDRCAAYLFGNSTGDRDADAIYAELKLRPGGLTRTEINVDVFHRHRTAEQIARALGVLVQFGLARPEMTRTGGRPEERWFPARHTNREISATREITPLARLHSEP
jgi:hypothetical protein